MQGRIVNHLLIGRGADRGQPKPTRSENFVPSAPPMPRHYSPQIELEVSSPIETISYVPMYIIMLDQNHVILYRNDMGVF